MFHVQHARRMAPSSRVESRPSSGGRVAPIGRYTCRDLARKSRTKHVAVARTPGGSTISYSSVLIAVLIGITHAGLAPVIEIAGVRPNLVLVAVVLVTALFGFGPGIVWAFVAGLTANLLVLEPLGSLPLALLLVSALVAGIERLIGRLTWLYPILAAFLGSVVADAVSLGVFRLVDEPLDVGLPVQLILPAAVLNAAILGLFLYPGRVLAGRLGAEERAAW